jgi:hypothetical protein
MSRRLPERGDVGFPRIGLAGGPACGSMMDSD